MWATSNGNPIRHIFGTDPNTNQLVSLCGRSVKGPLDYLKIKLSRCEKCDQLKGKTHDGTTSTIP